MKIIECPRDAMQGIPSFIPTETKVRYINQLLKVGFDTIDFGSFVSPKAIPQMRDTNQVLNQLDLSESKSALLAIVANVRGAQDAAVFEHITFLGFPLSISETFQRRNTNKSIAEALNALMDIRNVCDKHKKKLVSYISMGFGNPYGDPYEADLVSQFIDVLITLGTDVISLADTIGAATPEDIQHLFQMITPKFKTVEIGVHLHSSPQFAFDKIKAAFEGGCRRFDGALKGYGGCPMAKDDLVGNIATETITAYLESIHVDHFLNLHELNTALAMASEIFPKK